MGRIIIGKNDLKTWCEQNNRSDLLCDWNYNKNGIISPSDVACKSKSIVWRKCTQGHEWEATVGDRTRGSGCPYCTNKLVLRGYNDLATTKGHSYMSSVSSRTWKGLGCPICSGYIHPKIMCIETGEIYNLGYDAVKATGINTSSINQCCKGTRKTAGGFHWKYVE